jgi:hypothetical protein
MAIVDSAPDGGKFRAFAAAGLDGTAGAWGEGNLLCVRLDASGTIALGAATTTVGVILTSEGKRDNTHANYKKVVGGGRYTVLKRAILAECDHWASPALAAGDVLYAAASGDVTTTPGDDAVLIGYAVKGDGTGGLIFVLDVGGAAAAGALAPEDLKYAVINGGAAGNHTVTGITTADDLLLVAAFAKASIVQTAINGGAAGNHTVTGIATADTLISVIRSVNAVPTTYQAVINGAAAGNHTVTGILTTDTLVSVVEFISAVAGSYQTIIAGGAAGNHTVTGILTTDTLRSVLYLKVSGDPGALAASDITSEVTISAADTVENAGHTDTTGGFLIVSYDRLTANDFVDLSAEFTISAADTLENAGHTNTTGAHLLVTYTRLVANDLTDLTSEFTISAADTIENAGHTNTTGSHLIVTYRDALSDEITDLTTEFTISAADTIENAGHTATTGQEILIAYATP